MKFTKKKDYSRSVRKVWSDDKEVCFGVVGTVGDLLDLGILEYCDFNKDGYCFLPAPGIMQKAWFGVTRDSALENLIKQGF